MAVDLHRAAIDGTLDSSQGKIPFEVGAHETGQSDTFVKARYGKISNLFCFKHVFVGIERADARRRR